MAPHRRPADHRTAGITTIASAVFVHLLAAGTVDITASALHLQTMLRIALTVGCLVSHWHVHVRRHR